MLCGYSLRGCLRSGRAVRVRGSAPLRAFRRRSGFRATAIMNRRTRFAREHVNQSLGDAKNKQKTARWRLSETKSARCTRGCKRGKTDCALEWQRGQSLPRAGTACGKGRRGIGCCDSLLGLPFVRPERMTGVRLRPSPRRASPRLPPPVRSVSGRLAIPSCWRRLRPCGACPSGSGGFHAFAEPLPEMSHLKLPRCRGGL